MKRSGMNKRKEQIPKRTDKQRKLSLQARDYKRGLMNRSRDWKKKSRREIGERFSKTGERRGFEMNQIKSK